MQSDGDPIAFAEDLIAEGRPEDAAAFLFARIEEGRGGLLARVTLVHALLSAGDVATALEAARDAAQLFPGVASAIVALGDALFAASHLPTAIAEYQRALRLEPASDEIRLKLGLCWLEAGEPERALEQFAAVDEPPAALIARAEAIKARARSDAGYVRHLFDQFSSDYDTRMRGQLGYRAPEVLRDLALLVMPGATGLTALDLGCGTGFAAEAFTGIAAVIDGIDLSPAMIAKARERGLYRALTVADIESGLDVTGPQYDLVLAADTLVYLGDLAATFAAVARRLKPGGFFLFTVEAAKVAAFELGPKRRWRHSESYLRQVAEENGFDVMGLLESSPRAEAGVPVEGYAVALSRHG
ncbi:MAG: methyltransferase domain-containing protein [Proteobacteria bacterium]|nr:methyltransferase domain-containing protein [Pseudomonadota bacterium]